MRRLTLKEWFDGSGMTQAEAARVVGISQPHFCDLLSRRRLPSLRGAIRIERLTGGAVPANGWLDRKDEAAE